MDPDNGNEWTTVTFKKHKKRNKPQKNPNPPEPTPAPAKLSWADDDDDMDFFPPHIINQKQYKTTSN